MNDRKLDEVLARIYELESKVDRLADKFDAVASETRTAMIECSARVAAAIDGALADHGDHSDPTTSRRHG